MQRFDFKSRRSRFCKMRVRLGGLGLCLIGCAPYTD
jgi:hypothetical protein